jgi:uncharacterized protein (TIGR03437 family)
MKTWLWRSCGKSPRVVLCSVFVLVGSAGLLSPARAQFVQQGSKLVGTGAAGTPWQGQSVALSGDGNTATVGGPFDNNGVGAMWVYTRSGGVWYQQGGKLVGTGAVGRAYQGTSVALSSDGNTALVGGPNDYNNVGAAWVYTRSGGVWYQQGGKLVGTGAVGSAYQGTSVALSADGNTAIVGGFGDNAIVGAVWVFTRSGGVWSQQGGKLSGSGPLDGFGNSVALSGDGNTAAVAAHDRVHVYTRSGSVWSQQGGSLEPAGVVALSGDGNTAIVGVSGDNNFVGAAWVYTRTGGVWYQQGGKLVGIGSGPLDAFGDSVALSGDGNTATVGGHDESGNIIGGLWVFTSSGGVWSQQGSELVGTGAVGQQFQGLSVAVSADGHTAILGRPADNGTIGALWVFVLSPISSGPFIASGGVVSGADFLPGVAPGAWITIQGANLSTTTRTWTNADFSESNLPTQLDGVSVTVDGKSAYVYFISPTQLNVLSPDDATQGVVPVQVRTAQEMSNVVDAIETAISPALFTFPQQGGKYVAAVSADGTYIGPPNLISGLTTVPASPGETILLFGTGFGPTTPPTPIGQLIDSAPLANQVIVQIGGVAANTLFAGIVTPGLYQFNVVVPNVPNGDNAVSLEVSGSSTQPNVFMTIQR